jgi:hypothetical protein
VWLLLLLLRLILRLLLHQAVHRGGERGGAAETRPEIQRIEVTGIVSAKDVKGTSLIHFTPLVCDRIQH